MWFSRPRVKDMLPEGGENHLEYEYEEPERGPFDHPHRIREFPEVPEELPESAAMRMATHHAIQKTLQEGYGPLDALWLGIEVAEDQDVDGYRRLHEERKRIAEMAKQKPEPSVPEEVVWRIELPEDAHLLGVTVFALAYAWWRARRR